jgi:hypothetical protein
LEVGFWRGRKELGRGKPLFESFKEIRKGFEGILEGLFYPILKFPQIGGVLEGYLYKLTILPSQKL